MSASRSLTPFDPSSIRSMRRLRKVGHITPSCNSVLEPVTAMMTQTVLEQVSNHFVRIPVENISMIDDDRDQFSVPTMVSAAQLLADAYMDAIVWNGTSACWNGIESDIEICAAITRETGLPASTSTLAQYHALDRFGLERFALAVPYLDDVTARTAATYANAGYHAVSRANLGLTVGREMADVATDRISELIRAADSPDAQCVVVICTGLPAALVVEEMEREIGKPIFDSVAVTFWEALEIVGVPADIPGWGSLLSGDERVRALLSGGA
jgi:maleate isomerase